MSSQLHLFVYTSDFSFVHMEQYWTTLEVNSYYPSQFTYPHNLNSYNCFRLSIWPQAMSGDFGSNPLLRRHRMHITDMRDTRISSKVSALLHYLKRLRNAKQYHCHLLRYREHTFLAVVREFPMSLFGPSWYSSLLLLAFISVRLTSGHPWHSCSSGAAAIWGLEISKNSSRNTYLIFVLLPSASMASPGP